MPVDMPPIPSRMANLLKDRRGYPVPWFVHWQDGMPDFTTIARGKREEAHRRGVCWICGDHLGAYKCFVVGPMCTVNRISAEPPSHLQCAAFAAVACPFLVKPAMGRLPRPEGRVEPPGMFIKRNPDVTALWTTKSYAQLPVPPSYLFEMGAPTSLSWWREGRAATLEEVSASIAEGMPALQKAAEAAGEASMQELLQAVQELLPLLPRAADPAPEAPGVLLPWLG